MGLRWWPQWAGKNGSETCYNPVNVRALAIDPITPTTLYAGTVYQGAFKSLNGGSSWSAVNTGLTNTRVNALALAPGPPTTLYAGTNGSGVFAITFGSIGPLLTLTLNRAVFRTGEQLILQAMVAPGPDPVMADVYIVLQPPGCSSFACILFWQGGLNFTPTPQPIVRSWLISPVSGQIFVHTFGGPEPVGSYTWLAALIDSGTGNILGGIVRAPFTFGP